MLDIKKIGDPYSTAEEFVNVVNLLTGDFVTHVTDCDKLFNEKGEAGIIYFGS